MLLSFIIIFVTSLVDHRIEPRVIDESVFDYKPQTVRLKPTISTADSQPKKLRVREQLLFELC